MFSGNKMSPKQPLKVTRKVGFGRMLINQYGQAMMSGFYGVASFGPIGRYIVCVGDEFRVLRRCDDEGGLFRDHLVDGADTFTASKAWWDLPTLMEVNKWHLYGTYLENVDRIFSRYLAELDQKSAAKESPLELSGNAVSAVSVSAMSMDDEA